MNGLKLRVNLYLLQIIPRMTESITYFYHIVTSSGAQVTVFLTALLMMGHIGVYSMRLHELSPVHRLHPGDHKLSWCN